MGVWALSALLLVLAGPAGGTDVEMLLHGEFQGVLHPDGQHVDTPVLRSAGDCPVLGLAASTRWFGGAFTVDPPGSDAAGDVRYRHGDHGFGHGFRIVDDAALDLPFEGLPAGRDVTVEATLYRGHYHIAWEGPAGRSPSGAPIAAEVVASASWTGQAAGLPLVSTAVGDVQRVDLSLATAGAAFRIDEGAWLDVSVFTDLLCDPEMPRVRLHASEAAWPMMRFGITDEAGVKDAVIVVSDDGLSALYQVQHWRGIDGVDAADFQILHDGEPVAFSVAHMAPDGPYHHGVAPVLVMTRSVPADGTGQFTITMEQAGQSIFSYQGPRYVADDGILVETCGREGDPALRSAAFEDVCRSHSHEGEATPALPLASLMLALLVLARRRQA